MARVTQLREAAGPFGDVGEPGHAGGSRGCKSLLTLVGGSAPAELTTPGPWQGSAPWGGPHSGSKDLNKRSLLMIIVLGHSSRLLTSDSFHCVYKDSGPKKQTPGLRSRSLTRPRLKEKASVYLFEVLGL